MGSVVTVELHVPQSVPEFLWLPPTNITHALRLIGCSKLASAVSEVSNSWDSFQPLVVKLSWTS